MELIKQIKEAEKQAKEIVDKGRQDAAALMDQARAERAEKMKQVQQTRIEAIERAVADAETQGTSQVETLAGEGDQAVSAMKEAASAKVAGCVKKVVAGLQAS
ncbi:MAG: hypothetical protein ACYTET_02410 [Planctomycetota bacterium]|jgi:vacuolar-type H+-ATPase subunit H